jgi:hypothetical protein
MRRARLLTTVVFGSVLAGAAYAQSTQYSEYTSTSLQGPPAESDVTTFMGYSKGLAGQTLAEFYDELSQTPFVLDRESLDERVKNLRRQGLSADESERVVRTWPLRRDFEF